MRPLPLVFVLPRDWETVDFLSICFVLLFGLFFVGAGRTGKARRKPVESNRCDVLGVVPYHPESDAGIPLGGRQFALGFLGIPAPLPAEQDPHAIGTTRPNPSSAPGVPTLAAKR